MRISTHHLLSLHICLAIHSLARRLRLACRFIDDFLRHTQAQTRHRWTREEHHINANSISTNYICLEWLKLSLVSVQGPLRGLVHLSACSCHIPQWLIIADACRGRLLAGSFQFELPTSCNHRFGENPEVLHGATGPLRLEALREIVTIL